MLRDGPESRNEHEESTIDDNRLAKIAKNRKSNISRPPGTAFKTLVRKLNINITAEQAHWMKYRT